MIHSMFSIEMQAVRFHLPNSVMNDTAPETIATWL